MVCGFLRPEAMLFLFALITGMTIWEFCGLVNEDGVPDDVRASRLSLCAAVAGVLKLGLSLLGINVLERM